MKFTKTAVAVAIAGIAMAPMMAAAETTVSGILEIQLKGDDGDYGDDDPTTPVTEGVDGDLQVAGGDIRLNFNTQQAIAGGLTGYGNYRVDFDGLSNQQDLSGDSVYVGIKGGFGDIRIGEVPVVAEYGQVANDIFDQTGDQERGISYTGTFGPASIGVSYGPETNFNPDGQFGAGVKFGLGGFNVGAGFEERFGLQNYSAGASFAIAGASIAAHYVSKEGADADGDDLPIIAVQVGYGIAGVNLAVTYTMQDNPAADFETAIRLDAGYDLGGGTDLSTRITQYADDTSGLDDLLEYRVQLAKTF